MVNRQNKMKNDLEKLREMLRMDSEDSQQKSQYSSKMEELIKKMSEPVLQEDSCCDSCEMPKYKCIKDVWALKIKSIVFDSDLAAKTGRETDGSATFTPEDERYAPIKLSAEYVHKHKPVEGGYYVVYKDGYKSFSPASAFEEGYVLIP